MSEPRFDQLTVDEQRDELNRLLGALEYYARPSTWDHMVMLPDGMCGDIVYDRADEVQGPTSGGIKAGQVGRAIVSRSRARLGMKPRDWDADEIPVDRDLMASFGIDVQERYHPTPPPAPQPGDEDYVERTPCCGLKVDWRLERVELADERMPVTCPLCTAPEYVGEYYEKEEGKTKYLCNKVLRPCGHIRKERFDFSRVCEHVQAVRQGRSPAIEQLHEAQKLAIQQDN